MVKNPAKRTVEASNQMKFPILTKCKGLACYSIASTELCYTNFYSYNNIENIPRYCLGIGRERECRLYVK